MIIKRILTVLTAFALYAFASPVSAQSQNFKIGKNLDIQMNVLREIAMLYVDSVDVDSLVTQNTINMLASLDPYTVLIPDEDRESLELLTTGSYGGIGAIIRKNGENVLIAEVYENSPAAKAGLIDGDQIIGIDGVKVAPLPIDECSAKMRGPSGTEVSFTIKKLRSGDTIAINIKREKIHIPDVVFYGMVEDSVGYIRITGFTMGGAQDVRKALLHLKENPALKRVVLDLRGNGGGILDEAVEIVSLFVPRNTLVVSSKGKVKQADINYYTASEPVDLEIPLVVMVNSASASSSEIVAGALQDLDRATILGTRTFGKGLVQSIRDVGYNNRIKITTAKYYTPSGRCVQAIDYSQRNEDGSVGHIPDSLMKPFKTLVKGRTVYDGGGIMPDVEVLPQDYSRPVVSLVYSELMHEYSIEYSRGHETIEEPSSFSLTDQEYDQFVEWAAKKEFDHRTASEVELDKLKVVAGKEETDLNVEKELENLVSLLGRSKSQMLVERKDEIKPLLEEEIVNRYYYQRGRAEIMLRNDIQFERAKEVEVL
ncbi:MAG: S41 family peptidase [Bacteroidia bacterium]|jgi:carboxyl-terminal processing protease|nr:S41 family peptidase [Bacteroidia bacterium]